LCILLNHKLKMLFPFVKRSLKRYSPPKRSNLYFEVSFSRIDILKISAKFLINAFFVCYNPVCSLPHNDEGHP